VTRDEHAAYLALTTIRIPHHGLLNPYLCLCCFCRHAHWLPGACKVKSYVVCNRSAEADPHRVRKADGQDCRYLEPAYVLEDCVDAVGMHLRGQVPDGATIRRLPTTEATSEPHVR